MLAFFIVSLILFLLARRYYGYTPLAPWRLFWPAVIGVLLLLIAIR